MDRVLILLCCLMGLFSCHLKVPKTSVVQKSDQLMAAKLDARNPAGFEKLRQSFTDRNPGYDLAYAHQTRNLKGAAASRVAFIQKGGGTMVLSNGQKSKFSIGDIVMIEPNVTLDMDSLTNLVIFTVPEALPANIPDFVRPDWDPNITDTPGGCATETNAYRRILLTWMDKVGPYLFHSINAHRVRIMDSFTHYHPKKGGFDEFYLVQMVLPDAKLITSHYVTEIENPAAVTADQATHLLQIHDLEVSDLIYLPRGTVHRGLGGVLAQVITVPGFVPGSEIGVDHHLKAINDRLDLPSPTSVPYNRIAAESAVIK